MANKTFNNIQIFENFLHDVQNGVWGETKQPPEVLFSNLDPSGNTNLAVELAKIYSWAIEMFDFQPYTLLTSQPDTWDPTQHYKIVNGRYVRGTAGDAWATNTWYDLSSQPIMIDEDALPELGHTYEFRESTSAYGAFDVREDGGAWQTIGVKIIDPVTGKVYEAILPKYRVIPDPNSESSASSNSYDAILLQVSYDWDAAPPAEPTWTTLYNSADLGLFDGTDGKIKSALLPSYVDDVVEGNFEYKLLTSQPASFNPTDYFKIVDGKYVKGSVGDAWAADTWYTPEFVQYDLVETQPTSFDPTKYYKIVDGEYVKGTAGDAWAADTWYTRDELTGESGKIYIDDTTSHTYRCIPGTPEVWVDISNPISAAEIYELLGMPSDGNFSTTKHGLVPPASGSGDTSKFLRGDGTWATPTDTKYGLTQGPLYDANNTYQEVELKENGTAITPRAKIDKMTGVTYTLVTTQPGSFNPTNYWKLVDGVYVQGVTGETWAANTWYTATAGKAGLVTKPTTSDGMKYLRGDGTWGDPVADSAAVDILVLNCNHNPLYDPS